MKKHAILKILAVVAGLLALPAPVLPAAKAPVPLSRAGQALESEFARLDAGLRRAARSLGAAGLTGGEARAALAKLCSDFEDAVDCAAVDLAGRMVTVEPASYRQHEGADISGQVQVRRLWETGKPVLSGVFTAVEGFAAVDAEYPVSTPEGRRLGSVSVLFRPETLLGRIIPPLVQGPPPSGAAREEGGYQIWVMDAGGHILYDVDPPEIGQNLFTSPLYRPYPDLIELGRRIARLPAGEGVYAFPEDSPGRAVVTKQAHWLSVSLYGTPWRLVAVRVAPAR
jgi:hypothetical protein